MCRRGTGHRIHHRSQGSGADAWRSKRAVHRWDAQSAHRNATGFELEIALDGIDEMVTVMGPCDPAKDQPTGTTVLRTTDTDAVWSVRLAPQVFDVLTDAPDNPDAVLQGTASA